MNLQADPWLFNSSEIYQQSPSRVDGITWIQEKELRSLGCRFIHELVSKMRRLGHQAASEAVTESAACIFFHRFFTYESFKKHHRWVGIYFFLCSHSLPSRLLLQHVYFLLLKLKNILDILIPLLKHIVK